MKHLLVIIFVLRLSFFGYGQILDSTELSKYPLLTSFEAADTIPVENVLRLSFKRKLPANFDNRILKFNNLQELHLKSMRLKDIPSSVWSLKNLTTLDVSNNKLSNISEHLGELIYLEHLIINRNNISKLPEQISKLKRLRYIDMFSTLIVDFPQEISLLQNSLKEIDMRVIRINDQDKIHLQSYLPNTKFWFSNSCNCKN